MPTIQVNDLCVHYTERGSGSPLVLVHGGLATSAMMWNAEVVDRLAANHRVVMPDSRGHGQTTNPAGTLSYPQMADDLAELCSQLALTRPAVIGYSDGAQIGIELGLRHPGVASAFVLGGVVISRSPAYVQMLADMGFRSPGEGDVDVDAVRAAFGEKHYAMMVTKPHLDGDALVRQIGPLWANVPIYEDAQLATIREPCLVICGDRDRACLDDAVRLARALPTADLAVVPDSEHGAAGKPLFWANVGEFLARHPSGPGSAA